MSDTAKPQGIIDPTDSGPTNPAKYFASWKSTEESFVYYDKATKTKDVKLPFPFTFMPLARAISVRGYYEPEKTTYISNEVKNPKTDKFVVKAYNNLTKKSHVAFTGTWEEIAKDVKAVDGAWTECIYGAAKNEKGELEIMCIQLNGSGITHWFDFLKVNKIWGSAITVKEMSNEKKGSNKYKAPVFSLTKISEATNLKAAELQKQILEFLNEYWAKNTADAANTSSVNESKPATKSEPSAKAESASKGKSTPDDEFTDIINDIDTDDIPF